ncbi:transposase-like protein DUF772 [Prolixibacter denitrificans]|nr:transposase-like protein DUF772 [Prolixibacter denitrificans]
MNLDPNNRWVVLAQRLPWDTMAGLYLSKMHSTMGAPTVDARIVIGAVIIKHKLNLSDQETIATIQENVYMQYFLGLEAYTPDKVFDSSLFVKIRERLGAADFDQFVQELIRMEQEAGKKRAGKQENDNEQPPTHQGSLKVDATVADAEIKYPTDLDLLNGSREKSEELIDQLSKLLPNQIKPRTYRRVARKEYLKVALKKRKSRKVLRQGIRRQLQYLRRNLGHIDRLQEQLTDKGLARREYDYLEVIRRVYSQQREMYRQEKNSCAHRIVSIHQPHVRPIVRGKAKARVEFGAKLGVSLWNGYARIDRISWEAYNEAEDLKTQVERYRELMGYYPERVLADKIYLNRENREWLKKLRIQVVGKPLGRPSRFSQSKSARRKLAREMAKRNQVEGKFGEGKRRYQLNKIKAKSAQTAESWIGAIFLVMNLARWSRTFAWLYARITIFIRVRIENDRLSANNRMSKTCFCFAIN